MLLFDFGKIIQPLWAFVSPLVNGMITLSASSEEKMS
jgi:hypothetical protein